MTKTPQIALEDMPTITKIEVTCEDGLYIAKLFFRNISNQSLSLVVEKHALKDLADQFEELKL